MKIAWNNPLTKKRVVTLATLIAFIYSAYLLLRNFEETDVASSAADVGTALIVFVEMKSQMLRRYVIARFSKHAKQSRANLLIVALQVNQPAKRKTS